MNFSRLSILPLFTSLLSACNDSNESIDLPLNDKEMGQRTVLVYMAAQNSLGSGNEITGYHKADSAEMMKGRKYLTANNRLLMLIDDKDAPRLYQILPNQNKPRLVKRWNTDFCSTDPKRLQEVLELTKTSFPAKEYGLVMWSHADGWITPTDTEYADYEKQKSRQIPHTYSFGIDSGPNGNLSNEGAQMSITGMAQAIAQAGIHCKYVFFDACLMQNVEVGYALRHVADYVVASPVATPADGSYYTHNIQYGFFSDNPADIARTYLNDVRSDELQSSYADYGLCIACVQTNKLQALADVLKEALPHSLLANRNSPDMFTENEKGYKSEVLHYQPYCDNYYYRPHNYDALQALKHILPANYFDRAEAALRNAIVFSGATPSVYVGPGYWDYLNMPKNEADYCSVSMFIPQTAYTHNASQTRHGDLNEDFKRTEWYQAAGFAQTGW